MFTIIKTSFKLLLTFTILTGLIYPGIVTLFAQLFFPVQANGNIILKNGKYVGSSIIGQYFTEPKYFWGRPSATSPDPYNAASSSGSNQGQNSPELIKLVFKRINILKKADPDTIKPIPIDLVTASASGLDPDISIAGAYYQAKRIAKERKMDEAKVYDIINKNIKQRQLGFLGEPSVNVLELNLDLDDETAAKP
ncbi:MAG: potassium-transporting ATPase subunit KdpC [Desulfobacterales bacterium]|nr:potassium-transporting ATPase subunit KdpC [Desulfobacterales bacterium]MBF0396760.1 potassium-transporting ATPase subunit KdpC [Desulfobacterales bacterium]